MLKRSLGFIIIVFIFNLIFPVIPAAAQDSVYSRNGEVFVMVGSGFFKGVYKCQDIDDNGKRVQIPGGKKLFGAKEEYYSISVDQFRNIYVLSADCEKNPSVPPKSSYFPIDPPAGEGIVGIGADDEGELFYDVINYAYGPSFTYHGPFNLAFFTRLKDTTFYYDGVSNDFNDKTGADKRLVGGANKPPAAIYNKYLADYSPAKLTPNPTVPFLLTTPDQNIVIDFPNGSTRKDTIPGNVRAGCGKEPWYWGTHAGGCPCSPLEVKAMTVVPALDDAQVRRIGKQKVGDVVARSDSWYPGFFARWYYHGDYKATGAWGRKNGGKNLQASGNWQRRYDFKKQYIKLWITGWTETIPGGLIVPAGVTLPNLKTETDIETAFNTTNISYKADFASGCGEDHADTKLGVSTVISTDPKLSLTTTGAGRRYTYSSLPKPTVKQGQISLIKDGTGVIKYGVPIGGSTGYNGRMGGKLPLTEKTLSIGAATMTNTEDWVYASPEKEDGWDVIDYCIADQWDGHGGVAYRLLIKPGTGEKKLKWNKYGNAPATDPERGYKMYTVDPTNVKAGEMALAKDVKCIAADGRGSAYYLTDARPVVDAASKLLGTYDPKDESKVVAVPQPMVEDNTGLVVFARKRKYDVRAAAEVYYCDYYNRKVDKLNDITVGFETIMIREVFKDPLGKELKYRDNAVIVGDPVANIKLDIATINLAGPPSGNNERDCVDIVSTNANGTGVKGIKFNRPGATGMEEVEIDMALVDSISEDTQYQAIMENAPPKFTNDTVNINQNSGMALEDKNKNNIMGGFLYSIMPRTATYFWKVEMIEPMRKIVTPEYPTTKVVAAPAKWPPADRPAGSTPINFTPDENWYISAPGGAEALADFKFTPKEPGVYKISLIAGTKRYNYELMPYPSYITERDAFVSDYKYSFFDNGAGGGKANDGIRNGGEDYVAERYLVVTAKETKGDGYITNINITGPGQIDENSPGIWTASADIKFIRSIQHEEKTKRMETYGGIGVWDYPADVEEKWILKTLAPRHDVGEDYTIGAKAQPANCYSGPAAGRTGTIEAKLRNFGEVPPDIPTGTRKLLNPPPGEILAPAPVKVWGTNTNTALWVEGAGTTSAPDKPLNRADRGCIEYEWYLAAEKKEGGAGEYIKTKGATREPDILIAKGRLSDEMNFPQNIPGANNEKVVTWTPATYINSDRKYKVDVKLRYAFDMPLDPGNYYLYVKFKYPKLKWEGRSPKRDKDNKIINDPDTGQPMYSHYDLVHDGYGETIVGECAAAIKNAAPQPIGYKITVKDRQSPQAYFTGNDPNFTPQAESDPLAAVLPKAGAPFKGGTTGDDFPSVIKYNVCDNNPNRGIESALVAHVGLKMSAIAQADFSAAESEDVMLLFNEEKVKKVLEKMIAPTAAANGVGANRVIQDVTPANLDFKQYAGYGNDAPFRRAIYVLPARSIKAEQIPYDMVGSLPMYARGTDGSGNKIGDPNSDDTTAEINLTFTADAATKSRNRDYSNAPAHIVIKDNDSPSLIISVMLSRDGIIKRFALNSPQPEKLGDYHASFKDSLDWDPIGGGLKLKYITYGPVSVLMQDLDLSGNVKVSKFDSQSMTPDGTKLKQFVPTSTGNPEIAVDNSTGVPIYKIKFSGKNVNLTKGYDDYSPNGLAYLDYDQIVNETLEIIEDSRTKFELICCDNVDGVIAPAAYDETSGKLLAHQFYLDTENLGDQAVLNEVLKGWNPDKAKLSNGTEMECIAAYGIFREPTNENSPKPYMFYAVKDNSGNVSVMKIPAAILHTLMKRNVINVENRRSQ